MLMILLLDQHAAYVTMGRPLGSIRFVFVLISVPPKKDEEELD